MCKEQYKNITEATYDSPLNVNLATEGFLPRG